jgi:hypothetical protein
MSRARGKHEKGRFYRPFLLLFQVGTAAELLGKRLDDPPDHRETLIDAGLVVVSAALVQARQRDIDRCVIIAAVDETLDFFSICFDIHCTAPVRFFWTLRHRELIMTLNSRKGAKRAKVFFDAPSSLLTSALLHRGENTNRMAVQARAVIRRMTSVEYALLLHPAYSSRDAEHAEV